MQAYLPELRYLVGAPELLSDMQEVAPLEIFSPLVLDFLGQISSELIANRLVRDYPDVLTFGFFCRKANLVTLQSRYNDNVLRLARGVVFHIAPSNVPVNFAYSLIVGMLAGNVNIVRVSSKDFTQVDLICEAFRTVLLRDQFVTLAKRVLVVKYDRNPSINEILSKLADVRVIWGGDSTISEIRKAPLAARAFDITFSDRYSFAVLNADAVVAAPEVETLARAFYNDTYLFDQNACSAPRLIVWTGTGVNVSVAKGRFWAAVERQLSDYPLDGVKAIDKLATLYAHAGVTGGLHKVDTVTNKLWRIEVDRLSRDIDQHRCACGYFLEYTAANLEEIAEAVNRKYQTLAYYGYCATDMDTFMRSVGLLGIDRVVPIGTTTNFSLVWDGYDLIRSLSRECSIL